MTFDHIGFIGAGNMASSLVSGLVADGYPPDHLHVSDINQDALDALKQRLGVATAASNHAVAEKASVLVLAVKPQSLKAVLEALAPALKKKPPLLISIAAGISCASIERWAGGQAAIVRTMPNTPAMVGCGATGLFATEAVDERQRNLAEEILRAVGLTVWVDKEPLIDAVTALSGSGPAYFFLLMQAMEEAGIRLGLDPQTARLLSEQTALGAGKIAIETGAGPLELRRRVTSPGGTTEQAIATFEAGGFREMVDVAMQAAARRAKALSEQLGD